MVKAYKPRQPPENNKAIQENIKRYLNKEVIIKTYYDNFWRGKLVEDDCYRIVLNPHRVIDKKSIKSIRSVSNIKKKERNSRGKCHFLFFSFRVLMNLKNKTLDFFVIAPDEFIAAYYIFEKYHCYFPDEPLDIIAFEKSKDSIPVFFIEKNQTG